MRRAKLTAAGGAVVIVTVLFAAITTWSGAPTEAKAEAGQAYIIETPSPSPTTEEQHFDEVTDPAFTDYPEIDHYEPDAAEVEALARMLYGEARGIASDMEKAACVWCVLNRVDDPRFPDTVLEVLEAPYQFAGYSAKYPVLPELAEIAADVLTRYRAEKNGDTDAGRVLPAEYLYFTGDGRNNHFRIEYRGGDRWDWTLTNPYDD